MRSLVAASLTACALTLISLPAVADEGDEDAPDDYATIAFSGGVIVPYQDMEQNTNSGLDVGAALGWTAANGAGVVVNLEYAPLRHDTLPGESIDAHMFAAELGPRFTLGHGVVRVWAALTGGIIVERTRTELVTIVQTDTTTEGAGEASLGLNLHAFANGGLTVSGSYTHSFTGDTAYDYLSVTGGLIFTM